MSKKEQRKLFQLLKQRGNFSVDEALFEKDYRLSTFFSSLQLLKEKGHIQELPKLIFKGGTLLTKNVLQYHRISEDLDFTHPSCGVIRPLDSTNKQEKEIKKLIVPLFDEIKQVAEDADFEFEPDRSENSPYIDLLNSRAVYILYLYYESTITGRKDRIKIEINFVEELQFDTSVQTIHNLVNLLGVGQEANSLGYSLVQANMPCYSINEIILEKFRACVTRPRPKERDIFDLFLLNKQKDIFSTPIATVGQKIRAGGRATEKDFDYNLQIICKQLNQKQFETEEDLDYLSLQQYDKDEYAKFKKSLISYLGNICSFFNF